jgi:hypothetical protein
MLKAERKSKAARCYSKTRFAIDHNQQSLSTILSTEKYLVFARRESTMISRKNKVSPAMYHPNFCVECGERLARRGWRARLSARFCDNCERRLGRSGWVKPVALIAIVAVSAFALGRHLRVPAPPLLIQRAANSPLSDLPLNWNGSVPTSDRGDKDKAGPPSVVANADEPGYICGARTKKGTPCHRRVHAPGERCFQHKGMAAMVPLEKLVMKSK